MKQITITLQGLRKIKLSSELKATEIVQNLHQKRVISKIQDLNRLKNLLTK